mgnify:FL=1
MSNVNMKMLSEKIYDIEIIEKNENSLQVEADEQWSFVQNKKQQRWLWYAIDKSTKKVLAFVFGSRKDEMCLKLMALLSLFNINKYHTDSWQAYYNCIPKEKHIVGKKHTQNIERNNLTLRTNIKRLNRKTICFSKSIFMHDTVIGLYINNRMF